MLRQRRDQPADDPVAESLRTIIGQADRLDEMTAALLDISRIRVGRVPLRRSDVDVRGTARRIFLELTEVSADLESPESSPSVGEVDAVVDGDAARIGQIIRTMVSFLATRDGRGALSARLAPSADHVRVIVEDDGDPLAERDVGLFERLVEPASNSPTGWQIARPDLFIARGLAAAHGGTLEAESPADDSQRGVRFTLMLPRRPAAA